MIASVLGADIGIPTAAEAHSAPEMKPELTCISEEGLADMDLPDNLIDDLDYLGDCITSCNKVCIVKKIQLTNFFLSDLVKKLNTSLSYISLPWSTIPYFIS